MNKRTFLAGLFLLTAALSAAPAPQVAPQWDDPNAIPVKRTRIEIRNSDQVEVSVDIPGTITKLSPNARGGFVEKGEVVVELDSRLVEAQLKEANAKAKSKVLIEFAQHALEVAKLKLSNKLAANERSKARTGIDLYTVDEIREYELEAVKAQAELDKANEDQMFAQLAKETKETELAQYTRTASMSGIVTDMHKKSVGSAVRQGDPVMTIVNLDRVTAACIIEMAYEDRVNIGDTVLIRRTSSAKASGTESIYPNQSSLSSGERQLTAVQPQTGAKAEIFIGKVTFINPVKQSDQGNSFEIEAVIQNKSTGPGKFLLRENSFVEAVVIPSR